MPAALRLVEHLSASELQQRYLSCGHRADRTRWHALWLVSQGHATGAAGRLVGRSDDWAYQLVHVYNQHGPDAVPTVKRQGQARGGKPAALDPAGRAALDLALAGRPPGGGLWTGEQVAQWIEQRTGRRPHKTTGCAYLHRLGYRRQVPRPQHPEAASATEQRTFQKKSRP